MGSGTQINHSAGNIGALMPDFEELMGIFGSQREYFPAGPMATLEICHFVLL